MTASVCDVELRAEFVRKILRFQFFGQAELAKNTAIVGEERFADMEPGKNFLFKEKYFFSRFGQITRRTTAARAAANDKHIIIGRSHVNYAAFLFWTASAMAFMVCRMRLAESGSGIFRP